MNGGGDAAEKIGEKLIEQLSAEFRLLASCCRWPACPQAVGNSFSEALDWDLFFRLVNRHRVVGLVNHALAKARIPIPQAILEAVAEGSIVSAALSLRQAAEAHRIFQMMGGAGLTPTFVKGSTLSMLAYGTLSMKAAYDIDVLVPRDQLGVAFETLRAADYLPIDRDIDDETLWRWANAAKDTAWQHSKHGYIMELHTRLFANELLLPQMPSEPTRFVSVGGELSLPTLGPNDLLVYLSVHGAVHGWSRLKWLADFNALLASSPLGARGLVDEAASHGVDRAARQGILLAHHLLGAPIPKKTQAVITHDLLAKMGTNFSLSVMTKSADKELDEFTFGTVKIQLAHFLIRRGWRYKLAEIAAKTRQMSNAEEVDGGGSSLFIVALFRWLRRRLTTKRHLGVGGG